VKWTPDQHASVTQYEGTPKLLPPALSTRCGLTSVRQTRAVRGAVSPSLAYVG
jgi:hypothetical protein